MEKELTSGELFILSYGDDIIKLSRYIAWLSQKSGEDVSKKYTGEMGKSSLHFPVFDSTLLSFVKEARGTKLMDINYRYAYTRRRIKNTEEEENAILSAGIKDIDLLKAVLSKYVMEGMVKSGKWAEAVDRQLFLQVLCKLKDLLDFYNRAQEREDENKEGCKLFR